MPGESSALAEELGPIRLRFDDQLLSAQADSAEIPAFGRAEFRVANEFGRRYNKLTARVDLLTIPRGRFAGCLPIRPDFEEWCGSPALDRDRVKIRSIFGMAVNEYEKIEG